MWPLAPSRPETTSTDLPGDRRRGRHISVNERGERVERQRLVALDLEGVLAPEIWPAVGEATGVEELLLTTRDIECYEDLMKARIVAMAEHDVRFSDLLRVVDGLEPLEGAVAFLEKLQAERQVVILSDTFEQLADAMFVKLGRPFTLCHRLVIRGDRVVDFNLRGDDAKRRAVKSFQSLGYRVSASGDSHNDVEMLETADRGCLIGPPPAVVERCPHLVAVDDLSSLLDWILSEP